MVRPDALLLCALAGVPILTGDARAQAKDPAPRGDQPMQVVVARSAEDGCEPNCLEWIAAQGRIDGATLGQFKKVLGRLGARKLPVLIDSSGGSVDDAIAIGRLVRAKGLDVVVTKTVYKPCLPADAACRKLRARNVLPGLPHARVSKCASSCAFILAGGVRRYVGPGTFVGVHQVASFRVLTRVLRMYRVETRYSWGVPVETTKTLIGQRKLSETATPMRTTDETYEKIRRYFIEMGIAAGIMELLKSAPHDKIHVLSAAELRATGLATELLHGEQLLLAPSAGKAAVPSATAPAAREEGPASMPETAAPAAR
jgi:hypothetical protein